MRASLTTAALVLALGVTALGGPATASASTTTTGAPSVWDPTVSVRVVTTFDPGEGGAFAESMIADAQGRLIVSLTRWGEVNVGQLYRVDAAGTTTEFGPSIDLGACALLTGVTRDAAGRVYAAVANYDSSCGESSPPSGVLAVRETSVTQVLTMPAGTFANGVVVHRGAFYVTDSYAGSIWTGPTTRESHPTRPWFSSALLAPTDEISLGANGITSHDGRLFVTGYAQGYLMSVGVTPSGRPAHPRVVAHDDDLVQADGIAFGRGDLLWVTVNPKVDDDTGEQFGDGTLVSVDENGRVRVLPTPAGALDYPTEPAPRGRVVYVLNGSYAHGTPSLVEVTLG